MSHCLFGMTFPICVLLCLCIWCSSELSKSFLFLPFCTALISFVHRLILTVPSCFLNILQYECFDLSLNFAKWSLVAVIVGISGYFKSRFTRSNTEDTDKFLPLLVGLLRAVFNLVLSWGFYHHMPTSALPVSFSASLHYAFGILISCLAFLCTADKDCCHSHSGLNLVFSLTFHLSKALSY